MKVRALVPAVAAVFALGMPGHGASAGPIGAPPPTLSVTAASSAGGDILSLSPTLVSSGGGAYTASGSDSTPSFSLAFDLTVSADPTVGGSFTLTNLSGITQTFSVSAVLAILPIPGPTKIGGSFGDATYSDANGDGSVTIATVGSDPFYRALIDMNATPGSPPVGDLGSFDLTAFGGAHVFGTISQESFGVPIPSAAGPGVASSIGVAFPGFSLTPGDSVQVPFEFVVSAPEPGFASLFASGITLILLARAGRKRFQRGASLW